jgi:hypothetical protein
MPRPYRTLEEIADIFGISVRNTQAIITRYKIDYFLSKGKVQVHAKDFYTAYTKHCNPSLFDLGEKKPAKVKITPKTNADIFQKLFGTAYQNKKAKKPSEQNLIGVENFGKGMKK